MTRDNIVMTNIICLGLNWTLFQRDNIHIHFIERDINFGSFSWLISVDI